MEEIAGFEDRLAALKERGDRLVNGCSDRVQSRLRQQVQAHQQGTRDSYSAICSTAQRVSEEEDKDTGRGGKLRRGMHLVVLGIYPQMHLWSHMLGDTCTCIYAVNFPLRRHPLNPNPF